MLVRQVLSAPLSPLLKACKAKDMSALAVHPARKRAATKQENPLDALAGMLDSDMRAVNAVILDRMQSEVPLIPQLAGYLIAAGGKRIRPLLTLAAARLYGYEGAATYTLAAAVEFIHTATLLHDDVVDGSAERRGQAAANLVFGNTASVLVGDFLFSRAFQLMVGEGSLEVLRILSDASAIISEGEVMQLASLNDIETDWSRYIEIIKAKTAALFSAACEIGPVIAGAGAGAQKSLVDYGNNLGIAFQIADDVLDYEIELEAFGKRPGNDFAEGKLTAPVILALAQADSAEKAFWTRTMSKKQQETGDLAQAQEILARRGTMAEALAQARKHAQKAAESLKNAPNADLREILAGLAFHAVERRH